MGILRRTLLVTALLLAAARASDAASITFAFEGYITDVAAGNPTSVGDTFNGSFTYDPDTSPTHTEPGEAYYDGLLSLELTIGAWSGSATAPANVAPPARPIGLIYDAPLVRDVLFVQDRFDTSTTHLGFSLESLFLGFLDSTRSAFSSPVLPGTLDLSAFDSTRVGINWSGAAAGDDDGVITHLARVDVVPEPPVLGLACATGLITLLRRRRRR